MARPPSHRPLAFLAAALLGPACALLVSCGDRSALVPSDDADRMKADLQHVQSALIDGKCEIAQAAAQQVSRDVQAIPATVDQRLQQSLNEGAGALQSQVPEQCTEGKTTETETQPTETTETETTETQPTETTPPETQPTETVPTPPILPTPPETPTPPPGAESGNQTGGGITVPTVEAGGEDTSAQSTATDGGSVATGAGR